MAIQWFPGHMTSAKKKATETMERIDVVIEVLDARVPEAGSKDVPSGEYEVKITFSKEMTDQSWSWVTAWQKASVA